MRPCHPGRADWRGGRIRAHALDAARRVDAGPLGGWPGRVRLAEPRERALAAVRAERGEEPARTGEAGVPVIHFTPGGRRLDQALVEGMARGPGAVLLCGRYEGVDQRVVDRYVTLVTSLGDYVLSVPYTHLRAHETNANLVCRLLLEKKKKITSHN